MKNSLGSWWDTAGWDNAEATQGLATAPPSRPCPWCSHRDKSKKASSHLVGRQESGIPRGCSLLAAPSGNSLVAHHVVEQPVPQQGSALLSFLPRLHVKFATAFHLILLGKLAGIAEAGWAGMGQPWDGSWRLWVLLKSSATSSSPEQTKMSGKDGNLRPWGRVWGNLGWFGGTWEGWTSCLQPRQRME